MLADVLKQEQIPFPKKSVIGAGMALRAGPLFESIRFYVFYQHLSQAREIVDALFSSSDAGTHGGRRNTQVYRRRC